MGYAQVDELPGPHLRRDAGRAHFEQPVAALEFAVRGDFDRFKLHKDSECAEFARFAGSRQIRIFSGADGRATVETFDRRSLQRLFRGGK